MRQGSADPDSLRALAGFGPELAAAFVSIASDIALVIGDDGVIRNVAVGQVRLQTSTDDWVGRRWSDTVTLDTRRKIEQLLQEVSDSGQSRRREVNIPSLNGDDIPVSYSAIRLGHAGPVLAVGRDLRSIAAIQQRFIDAQRELERDYWQQRQAESRYRMLFQVANDAVALVDAQTFAVTELNQAASALLSLQAGDAGARPIGACFTPDSQPAVLALLATSRATGQPSEIRARLAVDSALVVISASPFRSAADAGDTMQLLVRARRAERQSLAEPDSRKLADYVERMSEGVIITDTSGRVVMANPAFTRLADSLGGTSHYKDRSLADTIGDPDGALAALLVQVRRGGVVRQRLLRVGVDRHRSVEVSAAVLTDGDQENIGLTLRPLAGDPAPAVAGDGLGLQIERLVSQLGHQPLPALLKQLTGLAERSIVETALARSQGNRARAAALLGIDSESLALRLLRFGAVRDPGDPASANGEPG